MKTEYRCENCKKKKITTTPPYQQICDPESCGVAKAAAVCPSPGCCVQMRYPVGTDHPRYCHEHEKSALKKVSQRHRKLDSYGE